MSHKNNVGFVKKTVSEKYAVSLTYTSDDIGSENTISDAEVSCSGLTLGTPNIDGLVVEFSVAGGEADSAYDIKVTITTSDGMTLINYVNVSVIAD